MEWKAADASAVKQNNSTIGKTSVIDGHVYNNADMVTSSMFNTQRGELGQWEFLKGIMTMFNLITLPDPGNPNNIIIEPYEDIFVSVTKGTTLEDRSIAFDWTNKIDASKMKIKPMDLKREVVFQYVEDEDDYPFSQYKKSSQGFLYGSYTLPAEGMTLVPGQITNLEGTEEIIAEPFAATICKPINAKFPEFRIPVIYGSENGWEFEGIDNLPRILYDNYIVSGSDYEYGIPGQNGVPGGPKDEYLQFSHFSAVPSSNAADDFNFGACVLIGMGAPTPNNLYNLYHAPYFNELYNINTKVLTAPIYLSAADLNTFDFRKQVMIKNRAYRVNKIDYKPNAVSTVELILIP